MNQRRRQLMGGMGLPKDHQVLSKRQRKEAAQRWKRAVNSIRMHQLDNIRKDEIVLADDHPVSPGYLYIVDGWVVTCPIEGTVADLRRCCIKEYGKADEVRNYQMFREHPGYDEESSISEEEKQHQIDESYEAHDYRTLPSTYAEDPDLID